MAIGKTPAKILIVDDHPMLREGLAMRISAQPSLEVCGEAASEAEGLALVKRTNPDLVIVDIALKRSNGIDLIKQIKAQHPQIKMLVVSGYDESLYAERSLRAGAMGYLNKQETNDKVIEAILAVLDGQRYVSDMIAQRLMAQALGTSDERKSPVERLSDRELEIFQLIGQGLTTGAIANRLHVSTHTIDTHRENIKRKFGVKNAADLSRAAVQWLLENG